MRENSYSLPAIFASHQKRDDFAWAETHSSTYQPWTQLQGMSTRCRSMEAPLQALFPHLSLDTSTGRSVGRFVGRLQDVL